MDYLWQINTHSTSTPHGDKAEMAAIHRLLDGRKSSPYITANKSCLGHTKGAAGAIESAMVALSIDRNIIPPTINIDNLDTDITKELVIVEEPRFCPADPEIAVPDHLPNKLVLKNSFGFGGTNCALLFAQFKE